MSARSVPGSTLTLAVLTVLALAAPALTATPAMAGTPSVSPSTAKAGPLATDASNGTAGGSAPQVSSPQQQKQPNASAQQYRAAPAGYPRGIDVSSHDHASGANAPNWPALAASGLAFTYVKASEGTTYVNPYFNADYNGAKSNGIYAGAYAFGRPDLGNPEGQADNLYNTMQWTADGRTLPPFIDMEWPYFSGVNSCYSLTPSQITSWLSAFINRIKSRTGVTPAIYTNVNWWNPCTNYNGAFGSSPLVISSCASSPPSVPGWSTWTFWQYDIGACGDNPPNDMDVFNGTTAGLALLAGPLGNSCAPPLPGDVNGDGRKDAILMCHRTDNSINLFTSPADTSGGFGNFNLGYTLPANAWDWNAFKLISGDFNGDGRADLAAMYHHSNGAISMNTSLADANGLLGPFTRSLRMPVSTGWDWRAD
jgi:GH25 family lysozyme M1 (1,4-beta-N-acetylmuramidase)